MVVLKDFFSSDLSSETPRERILEKLLLWCIEGSWDGISLLTFKELESLDLELGKRDEF